MEIEKSNQKEFVITNYYFFYSWGRGDLPRESSTWDLFSASGIKFSTTPHPHYYINARKLMVFSNYNPAHSGRRELLSPFLWPIFFNFFGALDTRKNFGYITAIVIYE